MSLNRYDTIVVGLGVAGLSALSTLARAGQRVVGLEAAGRLGGRVRTEPFADGVVELGAEWIHGTERSVVYELAMKNNITIVPQDLTFRSYHSDGTESDQALVNELVEYCFGTVLENPPTEPEPCGQFIMRECRAYVAKNHPHLQNSEFLNEFFEFLNLYIDNYEASSDWDDVTTASHYRELEGHQHMSWQAAGYRTLLDLIMDKHNGGTGIPGATVQLNKEVTRIEWGEAARVTCTDGAVYSGRDVIVTVSLGVLKHRHKSLFSPPLPQDKVSAIEYIAMGVMDKVILSFEEAWWPLDRHFYAFIWRTEDRRKVPDSQYWTTRVFGASRPLGASRALTLWTSGDVARQVELLPEADVISGAVALLSRFMGGGKPIPKPNGFIRSTWASSPLTLGSYSFDARRPPAPTAPRAPRAALARPLRGLRFAGEATHSSRFSTVHGAAETGLLAARQALDDAAGARCKI